MAKTGSVSDNNSVLQPARTSGNAPLYHSTYLVLRQKILDGTFAPERPMPAETELAKEFGVSRITIRRALDEIRAEGLITRAPGRGTFVTPMTAGRPTVEERLSSDLLENLVALGLKAKAQVLSFEYVRAPLGVSKMLEIEPGSDVQKAVRVRSLDGRPFAYLTTHVPEDIGRTYTKSELGSHLLLTLLERAGATAFSAEQSVSATAAEPQVAQALGTAIGEPLLAISRLVRDQGNRPVQYLQALYRPDIYSYRMSMTRVKVPKAALWQPARHVAFIDEFRGKSDRKKP